MKKNLKANKIDMHNVTFSPELEESKNTKIVKNDILTQGVIKLIK